MNWLVRMFTLPKKQRDGLKKVAANPAVAAALPALQNTIVNSLPSFVSQHVTDPSAATLITELLGTAIGNSGLFDATK